MMNRIRHIILTVTALFAVAVPVWSASRSASDVSEKCDTTDSRPLLKRIFKEFPTLYTDTAYTAENYIFVIRAVLHNNSWHRHNSCTKVITPADSDSTINDITADVTRQMVHFK